MNKYLGLSIVYMMYTSSVMADDSGAVSKDKNISPEETLIVHGTAVSESTTEGTDSYTTQSANTASKMNLSFRDTPQSTTVITRRRMDDVAAKNIIDVVKTAPGLYVSTAEGSGRPNFMSRGFNANVMYEGFSLPWNSYIPSSQTSSAIFDRVEIVRGATGLVQGAGDPSAAINMIHKRPTRQYQASTNIGAGRWNDYRGGVDVSGPLNDSATLRGRAVVDGENSETFRDSEKRRNNVIYGIMEADLTDNTLLTIGGYQQYEYNNHWWYDLPISGTGHHLNLPRSTFTGNDWEFERSKSKTAFATLEQKFSNSWKLKFSTLQNWRNADLLGTATYRHKDTRQSMYQQVWGSLREYNSKSYDLSLNGDYALFGRVHQFVAGTTQQKYTDKDTGYTYSPIYIENVNIFDHGSHSSKKPMKMSGDASYDVTEQKSAYAATHFLLSDNWKILLGGRLDWYEYTSKGTSINTGYKVTRNITKYAGSTYNLDDHHTIYGSYTDIFNPQSSTDLNGKVIKPIVGKNYETGIKGEYFNGLLNASLAVFQVDQENRARLLPDQTGCVTNGNPQCYEASGKVRTKGIDFELQGMVTPLWEIGVGYTYADTRYIKDGDRSNEGKRFNTAVSPQNLFKISSMYTFDGKLTNWRAGVNTYWQSK
ncbi:TonB-dependent siderophore receptor, partial [Escherichia coli]